MTSNVIRAFRAAAAAAGGSSFIAAKVNEAKDMLLGKKSKSSVF
jgi:hypothetical protein